MVGTHGHVELDDVAGHRLNVYGRFDTVVHFVDGDDVCKYDVDDGHSGSV